jgi:hypothetical protein
MIELLIGQVLVITLLLYGFTYMIGGQKAANGLAAKATKKVLHWTKSLVRWSLRTVWKGVRFLAKHGWRGLRRLYARVFP